MSFLRLLLSVRVLQKEERKRMLLWEVFSTFLRKKAHTHTHTCPTCLLVQRDAPTTLVGALHLEIEDGASLEVRWDNASAILPTDRTLAILGHTSLPAALTEEVGATLMHHSIPGDQQANGTLVLLDILPRRPFLIISTQDLLLALLTLLCRFLLRPRRRTHDLCHLVCLTHQVHSAQGCQGCDERLKLRWIKPLALHPLDRDAPGGGRKAQPSCTVDGTSRPIDILVALSKGHSVTFLDISPSSNRKFGRCTVVGVNLHPLVWWCWGIVLRTIVLPLLHVLLIIQSPHARGKVDDRVAANLLPS